jgi:predicted TIM-barrel fold metal-dependent hydrolase
MEDDLADMIRAMDRAGVDKACLFHIFYGDAARGNDAVAAAVAAYPDRFIGFAFVTPHYPEEMIPELERAFGSLGLRGLKIYPPYAHKPATDPVWQPALEWANERGIVILSHTSAGDAQCGPLLFVELAEKYPAVSWVLGHSGVTPEGREEAIRAAQQTANIYLEICSSWRNPGSIERLVEGAGADRVVYGSDMPLLDPRIQIARIRTSSLDEEAQRLVLGGNAARILGLG